MKIVKTDDYLITSKSYYVRLNEKVHPQCDRIGLMFYQSAPKSIRLIFSEKRVSTEWSCLESILIKRGQ
jgi:hypothetical protein